MSADSRSTHTDALATLGTIIGPDQKRDAIHLAVIPVVAGVNLYPGDRVFVKHDMAYPSHGLNEALGIVDPFLTEVVAKGETFWLVILPRTITSLRHVWSHPAFPEELE